MRARVLLAAGTVLRRALKIQAPPDLADTNVENEHFASAMLRARDITDRLPELAGREVLELGCAFGGMLTVLTERGAIATGVDVDKHRVRYAQGKGLKAIAADAERLPFLDESFDFIVSDAVLEHIPHIDRALYEAHRVLRPGGTFYASWGPSWFAYNGPHLIKCLGVPWVNLLFSDATIVAALEQQKRDKMWPDKYIDYKIADFSSMGRVTRRKLREQAIAQGFEIVEETSRSPRRVKHLLGQLPVFDELLPGELTVVLKRN